MADIQIRVPWRVVGNDTLVPLVTLHDNGDGTYSPQISAAGISSGGGSAIIHGNNSSNGKKGGAVIATDATTATDGKLALQTGGTFGTSGDVLQSDGTNSSWGTVVEASLAFTDITTADASTAKHGLAPKLGAAGTIMTSGGTNARWSIVQSAASVPAGTPTGNGFAYDSTAVTGGFYFWNGAAWVKVATIL